MLILFQTIHHLLSITHIQSQTTFYIPRKQAVICRNGANTGFILVHYGMFSWYRIWIMLTTKLDMLPDSWLKHYLNATTQHAYCVTQALTHRSRTKWELFCWRFFYAYFVWKLLSCDLNFTEMYPKVPINNKSMLVQIMAQWPTGGKPGQQIDAKSPATTKLKKC